jgi:hypothetical protein
MPYLTKKLLNKYLEIQRAEATIHMFGGRLVRADSLDVDAGISGVYRIGRLWISETVKISPQRNVCL